MSSQETLDTLILDLKRSCSPEPDGAKPVFWLGAGCSVHDEVPLNAELVRLLAPAGSWGSAQFRFDQMLQHLPVGNARARLLRSHFERTPKSDSPYRVLARLLGNGYADVVVTFNIDDLLERSLESEGLKIPKDFDLLSVPEMNPQAVVAKVQALEEPRIKVVKLHGDYRSGFNCMTSSEIVAYEEQISNVISRLSERTAAVCGYSFFHLSLLNAFSRKGGPFYYVNKEFPSTPAVLSLMFARSSRPLFIDEPLGRFDKFAGELGRRLVL